MKSKSESMQLDGSSLNEFSLMELEDRLEMTAMDVSVGMSFHFCCQCVGQSECNSVGAPNSGFSRS